MNSKTMDKAIEPSPEGFRDQSDEYIEQIIANVDFLPEIIERAAGDKRALKILLRLLYSSGGPELYQKVVPHLGRGSEIWDKFQECGENDKTLVEKYGKE